MHKNWHSRSPHLPDVRIYRFAHAKILPTALLFIVVTSTRPAELSYFSTFTNECVIPFLKHFLHRHLPPPQHHHHHQVPQITSATVFHKKWTMLMSASSVILRGAFTVLHLSPLQLSARCFCSCWKRPGEGGTCLSLCLVADSVETLTLLYGR